MRLAMLTAFTLMAIPAAHASGGLSCTSVKGPARIEIESGVTRGMGSPVFNFRGSVALSNPSVAPDLKDVAFTGEHVAQYWLDNKELRLIVYRERSGDAPHGYVEIELRSRAGKEGLYKGRITLTVFDTTGDTTGEGRTLRLEGASECFVE